MKVHGYVFFCPEVPVLPVFGIVPGNVRGNVHVSASFCLEGFAMRKNVKKQLALRVLSTAALVAMVSSIATAAFADTYDLNKGSVDILAEGGKRYITQWENESEGTYATDDKGEIKNVRMMTSP